MIVVLIRTVLRDDVDLDAFEALNQRMIELVQTIPGFISIKGYAAEDGEDVAIAWFESDEAVKAWREHPEHREAQRRGREEFFEWYDIQVCSIVRTFEFELPDPGVTETAGGRARL